MHSDKRELKIVVTFNYQTSIDRATFVFDEDGARSILSIADGDTIQFVEDRLKISRDGEDIALAYGVDTDGVKTLCVERPFSTICTLLEDAIDELTEKKLYGGREVDDVICNI